MKTQIGTKVYPLTMFRTENRGSMAVSRSGKWAVIAEPGHGAVRMVNMQSRAVKTISHWLKDGTFEIGTDREETIQLYKVDGSKSSMTGTCKNARKEIERCEKMSGLMQKDCYESRMSNPKWGFGHGPVCPGSLLFYPPLAVSVSPDDRYIFSLFQGSLVVKEASSGKVVS